MLSEVAAGEKADNRVPVTLLSGFLGSGKTSLLRHTLQNKEGLRVGVVVNDMAAVNIDSKLVRQDAGQGQVLDQSPDFVELQNGCMCCTMAEELFTSVAQLVSANELRNPGQPYDHILIESSGISEPRAVRDNFQDAEGYDMPLLSRVKLDTLVTVVDSAAFLDAYTTSQRIGQRPDLGMADAEEEEQEGVTDLTSMFDFESTVQRAVVDLLVEQVEVADVVVLNKVDLVSESRLALLRGIITALNPDARTVECEHGTILPLTRVLGAAKGQGVAELGIVDEHKAAVGAAKKAAAADCAEPGCSDPTHDHSHSHNHGAAAAADCAEPGCTDPTHDHSHSHNHGDAAADCAEPGCTDPTHDHSHSHNHDAAADCAEPGCTDPTHDHSHSHNHGKSATATTAEARFGIGSFVYTARRPFNPARLRAVTSLLPTQENAAAPRNPLLDVAGVEQTAEDAAAAAVAAFTAGLDGGGGGGAGQEEEEEAVVGYPDAEGARAAFGSVVRSKGFMWFAHTAAAACYWSHAGAHFEAQLVGRWWATVDSAAWPEWQRASILDDFEEGSKHGDRRQEVVFIGVGLAGEKQAAITKALDWALVDDEEMAAYEENDSNPARLASLFPNSLYIATPKK